MHSEKHPSLEQIIALLTGRSGDDAGALVGGCARCAENLRWARWLLDTARADQSVAPPPATLRRAFALFPAAVPASPPGKAVLRRLFGEMLFDSYRMPALGLTRGGAPARQLRYTVPELALEIALLLECDMPRRDRYSLTGQVLPTGADATGPALTAVVVRAASGAEMHCTLYETGEFTADSLAAGQQMLLVRTDSEEVALPIPGL